MMIFKVTEGKHQQHSLCQDVINISSSRNLGREREREKLHYKTASNSDICT